MHPAARANAPPARRNYPIRPACTASRTASRNCSRLVICGKIGLRLHFDNPNEYGIYWDFRASAHGVDPDVMGLTPLALGAAHRKRPPLFAPAAFHLCGARSGQRIRIRGWQTAGT